MMPCDVRSAIRIRHDPVLDAEHLMSHLRCQHFDGWAVPEDAAVLDRASCVNAIRAEVWWPLPIGRIAKNQGRIAQ